MESLEAPAPDTAPDSGLQEATEALAGQLDNASPSASPAPAPVREESPPPPPPTPGRQDAYKRYQGGYSQRQAKARQELGERRRLQEDYERRLEQTNQQMAAALDLLRAQGKAPEEEAPDPMDPRFPAWLRAQQKADFEEQLKPLREDADWRRSEIERITQEREQAAQQQQHVSALTQQLQTWHAEYQQDSPDLAFGAEERFVTVRDLISASFEESGRPPEKAAKMANTFMFAIARDAEESGENPIAAMDMFGSGLVMRLSAALGMPYVPASQGGGGYAVQPAESRVAPPQRSEIQRLAAVQQRSGAAGGAAPRLVGRSPQHKSEARELFAGGVTDMSELRAAALRDTHGNMGEASKVLQSLLG